MKERGLLFYNQDYALQQLSNISYFRIANYLRPFESDPVSHRYKVNSHFEDALSIYYFDKELRLLIFSAIQTIEIALRSKMIHHVSLQYGAFWFTNPELSNNHTMFEDNLRHIKREVSRSKEEFIQEHFRKYEYPDVPPVWKALEVTSFGTISKLLCNLRDNRIKKKIAREFNLPQHICLESWIKCMVVLRNCLAHHARIWNRRFPQIPQLSYPLRGKWIDCAHVRPIKLYAQLSCLIYLQNSILPNNNFVSDFKQLLVKYPSINLHEMGFPENWNEQPLWKGTV